MTDDIAAFVLDRITEEETIARAAGAHSPEWNYDRETFTVASAERRIAACMGSKRHTPLLDIDGTHIARQDPAATLARCAALRRFVAQAKASERVGRELVDFTGEHAERAYLSTWRIALREIAGIWEGHAGYQPGWAP